MPESVQMTNDWGATGSVMFTTESVKFLRDQTTAENPVYAMFDGLSAGHGDCNFYSTIAT